jgi:hypothetical protein
MRAREDFWKRFHKDREIFVNVKLIFQNLKETWPESAILGVSSAFYLDHIHGSSMIPLDWLQSNPFGRWKLQQVPDRSRDVEQPDTFTDLQRTSRRNFLFPASAPAGGRPSSPGALPDSSINLPAWPRA